MHLTLILTPSFSSPILEENAVGVRNDTFTFTATSSQLLNQKIEENAVGLRNDTFTCTATSSQLLNQKIQVIESKSFTNFAFKTLTLFFCSMFSFKLKKQNWQIWQAYFVYRTGSSIFTETYSLQRV